jgi:hypothetical protein
MKRVYFLNNITNEVIEGDFDESQTGPLKEVTTVRGKCHTSSSTKFWYSKNELVVDIFVTHFKNYGIESIIEKYNLDKQEAKTYLESALDKYPETFI